MALDTTLAELSLSQTPLFGGLTEEQIEYVVGSMQHLCYEAGSTILSQGEENQGLWLLSDGCCEVVRTRDDDQGERVLAVLGPGNVFGEMSFFRKTPHSSNVRAVTKSTVHKLDDDAFEELRSESSEIAATILVNLVSVLAERLKLMDNWVCELTEQPAKKPQTRYEEWHDFRAKLYREWNF